MERKEEWRQVVLYDYEPVYGYEVSNNCEVRSVDRLIKTKGDWFIHKKGKTLSQFIKPETEYHRVCIYVNGKKRKLYVHTLVALAFPEICGVYEEGLTVDHLNGKQWDNIPENLCWKPLKENIANPVTLPNKIKTSIENLKYASTPEAIEKMKKTKTYPVLCIETGIRYASRQRAAEAANTHPMSIWRCCKGIYETAGGFHWSYC